MRHTICLSSAPDGSGLFSYRGIEFKIRKERFGWHSGEIPVVGKPGIAYIYGLPSAWTLKRCIKKIERQIDKDYTKLGIDKAISYHTPEATVSRFVNEPGHDWDELERRLDKTMTGDD